ncbi:hypothetical protein BB558_004318 [Smittium angustum]|uniref:CNH domain-containing protein n=1 Tax=Smittium angustum TaxID=133377 RepID=A0A2U1J3T6_SMIAN|nr:hypothetical protein BB558_004318 [Smittium angustum]
MLRAAFKTIPILETLPIEIKSIASYGNKLLLGSASGSLLVYNVKDNDLGDTTLTLVDTKKDLSKKSIDQLEVIKEAGVLACLTDNAVTLFDLNTFTKGITLKNTKGASIMTAITAVEMMSEIPTIISKLAVVSRKKIIIFEWRDSEYYTSKEYPSNDKIESISFGSVFMIIAATQKDFWSLQLPEGQWDELFSADTSSLLTIGASASPGLNLNTNFENKTLEKNATPQPITNPSSNSWSSWTLGLSGVISSAVLTFGTKSIPIIEKMANDELLLCRESTGIFVTAFGKISRKRNSVGASPLVQFLQEPTHLTYTSTYIISISNNLSEKTHAIDAEDLSIDRDAESNDANSTTSKESEKCYFVEVRNILTHSLVQQVELTFTVPPSELDGGVANKTLNTPLLITDKPHLLCKQLDGKQVWVAGKNTLWKLHQFPISQQVEEQISIGNFHEAESLASQSDMILESERQELQQKIKWLQALNLIKNSETCEQGLDMFFEMGATPTEAISTFPKYISGELATEEESEIEAQSENEDTNCIENQDSISEESTNNSLSTSTNQKINKSLVNDIKSKSESNEEQLNYENSTNIDSENRVSIEQQNVTRNEGTNTTEHENSNNNNKNGDIDAKSSNISNQLKPSNLIKTGRKADTTSLRALMKFLVEHRRILQRSFSVNEKTKIYLIKDQSMTKDDDSYEESITSNSMPSILDFKLIKAEVPIAAMARFVDTTLLKVYLECAPSLAGSLVRVENYCNVQECEELLLGLERYKDLIDLYFGKGLHRSALELLYRRGNNPDEVLLEGTMPTVSYLQKLPETQLDLIIEFSHWIFEKSMLEMENSTNNISSKGELDDTFHPLKLVDVIFSDERPATQHFSREKVAKYLHEFSVELSVYYLNHCIQEWKDLSVAIHDLMTHYLVEFEKLLFENVSPKILKINTCRLKNFLRSSQNYTPIKLLAILPDNSLFEEKAIVLGRMGQFTQGLILLTEKVGSNASYEEYCLDYIDKLPFIFVELAKILLESYTKSFTGLIESKSELDSTQQKDDWKLNLVLDLLSKHSSRMPANQIIPILPDSLLLSDELVSYLTLQSSLGITNSREEKLALSLCKSESMRLSSVLVDIKKNSIKLTKNRVCVSCLKKLGSDSAFVALPAHIYELILKNGLDKYKSGKLASNKGVVKNDENETLSLLLDANKTKPTSEAFVYANYYSFAEQSEQENDELETDAEQADIAAKKTGIKIKVLSSDLPGIHPVFNKYYQDQQIKLKGDITSNVKLLHYSCWQRFNN